jgi:hypothetical protein
MMRSFLKAIVVVGIVAFLFLVVRFLFTTPKENQLSSASQGESKTINDHELHLINNLIGSGTVTDGRTYSVALIDENKNSIPTGTELFVQGTLYTVRWGPTDDCSWLLIRGRTQVQHGELNPRIYCYFSLLLDEKGQGGRDLWPSVSLVCNMSPEEFKEATHLYHYGDEVQVHGVYGSSLDFDVVPIEVIGGGHFGVPALQNCTVAGPTEDVVRPQPAVPAAGRATETPPRNSETRIDNSQPPDQPDSNGEMISQPKSAPSGVSKGETPDEVMAILGPPASVTTGAKHVFLYPHLKVVFADGKVSEVQEF